MRWLPPLARFPQTEGNLGRRALSLRISMERGLEDGVGGEALRC
jgi:hypothetical protein